jgi:hypothetical protein
VAGEVVERFFGQEACLFWVIFCYGGGGEIADYD